MKRFLLVTAVALGLATGGVFIASADWAVPAAQAKTKTKAGAMPKGVTPSVAPSGPDVIVSWSAQEIAGSRMQSYLVTAHAVSSAPITRIVTAHGTDSEAVTFDGDGLAGDTWRWTITARHETWTGKESAPSRKLTFAAAATAPADKTVARVAPPAPEPPAAEPEPAAKPDAPSDVLPEVKQAPTSEPATAKPAEETPEPVGTSISEPTPTTESAPASIG